MRGDKRQHVFVGYGHDRVRLNVGDGKRIVGLRCGARARRRWQRDARRGSLRKPGRALLPRRGVQRRGLLRRQNLRRTGRAVRPFARGLHERKLRRLRCRRTAVLRRGADAVVLVGTRMRGVHGSERDVPERAKRGDVRRLWRGWPAVLQRPDVRRQVLALPSFDRHQRDMHVAVRPGWAGLLLERLLQRELARLPQRSSVPVADDGQADHDDGKHLRRPVGVRLQQREMRHVRRRRNAVLRAAVHACREKG